MPNKVTALPDTLMRADRSSAWAVFFDVYRERCSQAGETLEIASTSFAYNLKGGVQ